MRTFRLLHLSDFHVGATPRVLGFPHWGQAGLYPLAPLYPLSCSSYDPEVAEAVARFAYLQRDRFDFLLVTGDLATTGKEADLRLAFDLVHGPPSTAPLPSQPYLWAPWLSETGFPTLGAAGRPVALLPGNHDRFRGIFKRARGTQFDATFSLFWRPDPVQTLIVLDKDEERLAVIAADFCLAANSDADKTVGGRFAYLGQGRAYRDRIAALEQETTDQRRKWAPVATLWAVHFPPAFEGLRPDLCLLDDGRLTAAAHRAGIEHLFCGHTHEPRQYRAAGLPPLTIYCAGTAMQHHAPPPFTNSVHLTEIDVEKGSVVGVRWGTHFWSPRRRRFVPPDTLQLRLAYR